MLAVRIATSFVLSLSLVAFALAEHFVCEWLGPGPDKPPAYGFVEYCTARRERIDQLHARYLCEHENVNTEVANWGYLEPLTLEVLTPRGKGGYARNYPNHNWAVCLLHETGPPSKKTLDITRCLYLKSHDDCAWPVRIEEPALPPNVRIYYK